MSLFKKLFRALSGNRSDQVSPALHENQGEAVSIEIAPPPLQQEAIWTKKHDASPRSRAGDTKGALQALEEAQSLTGAPQPHDEIRRAKYLQKDGRSAEAWAIYQRLLDQRISQWVDVDVLDAMRLHLQRDGQAGRAIDFGIAHRLARVELYRHLKREDEQALNGPVPDHLLALEDGAFISDLWERQREGYRMSIESAAKWISELTDPADIADMVTKLAKKAAAPERSPVLVELIKSAITSGKTARDYLSETSTRKNTVD